MYVHVQGIKGKPPINAQTYLGTRAVICIHNTLAPVHDVEVSLKLLYVHVLRGLCAVAVNLELYMANPDMVRFVTTTTSDTRNSVSTHNCDILYTIRQLLDKRVVNPK